MKNNIFMKIRRVIIILICGFAACAFTDNACAEEKPVVKKDAFSVSFVPAVAYRNEPAAFVLKGTPGTSVSVSFGKKELEWSFTGTVLESRISFPGKGILTLTGQTARYSFRILRPDENSKITIKNDWPHDENGLPIILLPDHCHPPKVNRTWQMARWLEGTVKDQRPKVSSLSFAGGRWICASDRSRLKEISGNRPRKWRIYPPTKTLFEIHGIIAQMQKLTPDTMLVLSFSVSDLERGLDPLWLRMKLEWLLQSAGAREFKFIFVLGLPLTAAEQERYPEINKNLKLACRSNRAFFVDGHFENMKNRVDTKQFFKRAMRVIQKTVCVNETSP